MFRLKTFVANKDVNDWEKKNTDPPVNNFYKEILILADWS